MIFWILFIFVNFGIWLISTSMCLYIDYKETKDNYRHKFDVSTNLVFSFISMIPIINIFCMIFAFIEMFRLYFGKTLSEIITDKIKGVK